MVLAHESMETHGLCFAYTQARWRYARQVSLSARTATVVGTMRLAAVVDSIVRTGYRVPGHAPQRSSAGVC